MKSEGKGFSSPPAKAAAAGGWEVRPGGMLVQRRSSDSKQNSCHVPNIKVRVKYGSSYREVSISSQASFGELKKMLSGPTGLHTQDQKLIFKEKERDSKAFLDIVGVKDGSKIVLVEDDLSRERRCLELRRNAVMEKASKEIAAIRFEVDKLAKQVASIELEINGGKKVVETVLLNLIELLMTQLIKLDGISADGDVKLQRRMQDKIANSMYTYRIKIAMFSVSSSLPHASGGFLAIFSKVHKGHAVNFRIVFSPIAYIFVEGSLNQMKMGLQVKRVQKYIETLDVLKMRNSGLGKVHLHQQHQIFTGPKIYQKQQEQRKQVNNFTERVNPGPVVVTTKWETF
ncbi:BAG family molecular chaperone regulator 1 [Sesamum angolense]|uniref:BAG family molecular chaperone regulator 1 n=1 Tax=Sesamum angolense TaxID=2727404 RepID=A0AAE2BL29_9LAMI|nr:BAG family molecular chaperone regulator 1 [Sesamum angolense]